MKIDGDHVDLFPTAEAIFRDYRDEIIGLARTRRNILYVFVLTSIVIYTLGSFSVPLIIQAYHDYHAPRPGGVLLYGLVSALLFLPVQYAFLDGLYRAHAKRKCLDIIAQTMKMTYRRGGFFRLVSVYDHHILPSYSTRTVEEGFSGKFRGFRIEFQDFFINPVQRYFDGLGYRSLPTFEKYYGLVMKVPLNKIFQHHTVLLPARDAKGFLARLPNANLFFHEDVNLVYGSFTRRYTCLSTHQVEARYILDPAVMQRFIFLAEAFDTDRISASFMNDEMVIVMRPLINLFEVGSLRDPVTVLTIERTLNQINALRQMADIFELNEYSGLGARLSKEPPL